MVSFGEQTVPSGITALLIAMMPVWVAVLGRIFLGERLPRLAVVGIVAGFAGVAILIGPSAFGGSGALGGLGLAAIIVSPISWASGSLFASHRARLPRLPLLATGLQMLSRRRRAVGDERSQAASSSTFHLDAVSPASLGALAYLTVVGSLVAFTAYGWLLRVAPLPLIATYAYVNPVVAVVLGALVRSEPIDARTLVAGAVIVAAVALIVTARGRMRSPREPDATDAVTAANAAPAATAPTP